MPAQAERLQRRLGPRDRHLIAAILTASAVATAAAALFIHTTNPHRGSAECITYNDAGVMGGGTWNLCGAVALAFCRKHVANRTEFADECAAIVRTGSTVRVRQRAWASLAAHRGR